MSDRYMWVCMVCGREYYEDEGHTKDDCIAHKRYLNKVRENEKDEKSNQMERS